MTGGLRKFGKTCEDCEKLADPDNYPKGTKVRIIEAFDCENCEVKKHQVVSDNENIVTLYNALPQNYDGYSGLRIISATDIKFVLEIFEVSEKLRDDYYKKLVYFHREIVKAGSEARKEELRRKEAADKWKTSRMKSRRVH